MEREKHSENKPNLPRVVRVFPLALRTPQSILTDYEAYKTKLLNNKQPRTIELTETYLGLKSSDSIPSPSMINAMGGSIEPGEDLVAGAIRKMNEVCTLVSFPISNDASKYFEIIGPYSYRLKYEGEREVFLLVLPVVNQNILSTIYPYPEKKFSSLVELTPTELILAIQKGKMIKQNKNDESSECLIVGHLTTQKNVRDVDLTKYQKRRRNSNLHKLTNEVAKYEDYYRKKLVERLINLAKQDSLLSTDELKNLEQKTSSLEKVMVCLEQKVNNFADFFNQTYGELLSYEYLEYFREVEKQTEVKGNYEMEETKRNWIDLRRAGRIIKKMFKAMIRSKKLDLQLFNAGEIVKTHSLKGNLGVDILHFLPLFVNLKGARYGEKTQFINSIFDLLFKSAELALKSRGFKNLKSFNDVKAFIESEQVTLGEKLAFIKKFDAELIKTLSIALDFDQKDIKDAWVGSLRFIPTLAEEIRGADPKLSRLYQFHELLNEIGNISFGQTLLYLLGIDQKDNKVYWPRIKFESFRQIMFFLKVLLEKKHYYREISNLPNPLDLAINGFFGTVKKVEILEFFDRNIRKIMIMPVEIREGVNRIEAIIDKKPLKSLYSMVRKSHEEPPDEIRDFFSVNIIFTGKNMELLESERINIISQTVDRFLDYIKTSFPDFTLKIDKDENTFDNYQRFLEGKPIEEKGKRTGSIANKIIRRKIALTLTDKNGMNYYYELAFYPFESLAEKTKNELMGWKEKIADDPSYILRRILLPLKQALGLQSFYELLYPASIYPHVISRIRSGTVFSQDSKE